MVQLRKETAEAYLGGKVRRWGRLLHQRAHERSYQYVSHLPGGCQTSPRIVRRWSVAERFPSPVAVGQHCPPALGAPPSELRTGAGQSTTLGRCRPASRHPSHSSGRISGLLRLLSIAYVFSALVWAWSTARLMPCSIFDSPPLRLTWLHAHAVAGKISNPLTGCRGAAERHHGGS